MATQNSQNSSEHRQREEQSTLLPHDSAADFGRSNRTRVEYDQHISDILEEHAYRRAPENCPDRVYRNHLLGISAEVGVATWRNGEINTEIYPDYCGDDGVDVVAPAKWGDGKDYYQVKATRDVHTPEQWVTPEELNKANRFALCATNAPSRYVEIVGTTKPRVLQSIGIGYPRDEYLLSPEYLEPVTPTHYSPDDVRDVMYE